MRNMVRGCLVGLAMICASASGWAAAQAPDYFTRYDSLRMTRGEDGVLIVAMHDGGGPIRFTAQDHRDWVDAFYAIARDRDNKVVILTGAGGEWMADIDFASFGNVADPDVWATVQDEGTQILENIANIRASMICAVEGRAFVHSEYCLMANVVVAATDARFSDAPHFAGGIVPGDGIFTVWSYRAGPGRTEAFLLNPSPISAAEAKAMGVVAELTPKGGALERARALAALYLRQPEVTRRNTRAHFIHPLKLRIIEETGYGLALEGASAGALVKQIQQQSAKR